MDWNEKLQEIIDYVEQHLQREQKPIDPQEIARIAGCSIDFFQKVFSYMNGISFADYIRSRKLTLAGYDLKSTKLRVIDISYRYGYDSPTSFTKAFQQFHGMTPSEARKVDAKLNIVPRMQMYHKQKYVWRLEQKPSLRLIGKSIQMEQGEQFRKVPAFWSECQRNGVFADLISMDEGNPQGLFGVFTSNDQKLIYSIMAISNHELLSGYHELHLPEATWAIFECRGMVPQAIQNCWKYLEEEWLIEYPFAHANCPELEWYSNGNSFDENYASQIWIPVIHEENKK